MDLSERETQLVELLREWDGKDPYQLTIERRDRTWEISLKQIGTNRGGRGFGATFEAAWDNMNPL